MATKNDEKQAPKSRQTKVKGPAYTNPRTGMELEDVKQDLAENMLYVLGKPPALATPHDCYKAVAYSVRNRLMKRWIASTEKFLNSKGKAVCYFSAEFLIGPQLYRNLINLDMYATMKQAVKEFNLDLADIIEEEQEPGLGNGGLGRLAACYIESLATLGVTAVGFGIRYEHGMFHQTFHDGWQVELTDNWLHMGNPWEIPRPDRTYDVKFNGHTEVSADEHGIQRVKWIPGRTVKGMAYDVPILGYKSDTACMLRLWKAEATESFDFQDFNQGDYYGAVESKVAAENITKVLYPNDEQMQGKRLRLEQQFFFVSCSLQNMIDMHLLREKTLDNFYDTYAAQLNDTHPAVAVCELMRLFVDEHSMDWENAWHITQKTFSYTNHTLLPEALEKWPLPLFAEVLPRHLEIIYEINQRFLDDVRNNYPQHSGRIAELSLIEEAGEKYVRMANLACVGSHAVNGVARLHTELLKEHTLNAFYALMPQKFSNKTNGVTPRRWVALCNPRLTGLLNDWIGDSWLKNMEELQRLEDFTDDEKFLSQWWLVKQNNKRQQAEYVLNKTGVALDTNSMFDVQVKRIHEYKRQHLNILHILTLYNRIKKNPGLEIVPRTFVFGGKAAPGYYMAKLIIKLINSVAEVVNADPDVKERLKVVFVRNFNVKLGHRVYPPADLSEQISTAGKEASGTGNMKLMMNGAVTIGTLDGANVEILEAVGEENFFLFGLAVDDMPGENYDPQAIIDADKDFRRVMRLLENGHFNRFEPGVLDNAIHAIRNPADPWMTAADFRSFVDAQELAGKAYLDQKRWTRMSILNTASSGRFSTDRTMRDYNDGIWKLEAIPAK
jgi:starch phosphorylase